MKKRLKGIVVSDKADKTVAVEVKRWEAHAIYKKKFTITKKYQVDDPNNKHKIGDSVTIEETRPISKYKRWRIVNDPAPKHH